MNSKRFVYGFLIVLGACMVASLYFFLKQTSSTRVDAQAIHVDWQTAVASENVRFNGEMQFAERCESCHGPRGTGGLSAPALNDSVWIHGGSTDEIFEIVCNGVPGTQMKGWGDKLFTEDLVALTVYVKGLSNRH